MADLFVVEELKAYLVAQGVAQPASAAPSTTLPSIWLQPREGAPAPRREQPDGGAWLESATISLVDTLAQPASNLEGWLEETFVDVIVRARTVPTAKLIHRQIRGLLVPNDALGGRKLWTMNTLLVEYSTAWRGEQPVWNDDFTYVRTASYRFGVRRKALQGLPYAP